NLQAPVISVRTDRGTEFLNKTLNAFFKEEGIEHQTSTPRTPEQNGVVERRNRTLVEAARTMLSASKLLLFFWAEAITTACYTQNRSIVIPTHEKTAYHIRNNLTVATMQVNVQFLQQLQPEWSRFVTIVKQQHKLDEVSYHKLFGIMKQYQKEVNELRAERMTKNANLLALVATAQTLQDTYYQTSKPHPVARLEAVRIFVAYAAHKSFPIYQMD
ncbi:retrovirus-related pol polyprotein from transposon TNT 1-94, partial [Tanacetum coccineum]